MGKVFSILEFLTLRRTLLQNATSTTMNEVGRNRKEAKAKAQIKAQAQTPKKPSKPRRLKTFCMVITKEKPLPV